MALISVVVGLALAHVLSRFLRLSRVRSALVLWAGDGNQTIDIYDTFLSSHAGRASHVHPHRDERVGKLVAEMKWWKGRESNPRPRHYECRARRFGTLVINHLPRASVAEHPH